MKQNTTPESVLRANRRYDDKMERVNCRFDPGTKKRIEKLGYTVNNFIRLAVMGKLEWEETVLGKKKMTEQELKEWCDSMNKLARQNPDYDKAMDRVAEEVKQSCESHMRSELNWAMSEYKFSPGR